MYCVFGKVMVSNDQIYIWWQIVNGVIGDGDLVQVCILYFFMQYFCVYCVGIYIGIVSYDDFMYMVQVVGDIFSCQWRGVFRFCFYVMYMMGGCFNVIFFFYFVGFQQNCRNYEGDCYCCYDGSDVSEVSVFWCYCQYCQN